MEFTFEDFKKRANDISLSKWEKIGFPDSYRENSEYAIFQEISSKVKLESSENILDIGCGCSTLVENFISYSTTNNKNLYLVDSDEMLSNIDRSLISKQVKLIKGLFPSKEVISQLSGITYDSIIVYSVLQYIFLEQNLYKFIHHCIDLLKPGGSLLLGDLPNFQSRERFLASEKGKVFLKNEKIFNNTIEINHENAERIDDGIIISILIRFRQFGCETYLLPQSDELPFSNRREDILIVKR